MQQALPQSGRLHVQNRPAAACAFGRIGRNKGQRGAIAQQARLFAAARVTAAHGRADRRCRILARALALAQQEPGIDVIKHTFARKRRRFAADVPVFTDDAMAAEYIVGRRFALACVGTDDGALSVGRAGRQQDAPPFGAPDQFVLCGRTGDHDRSGAAVRTVVANRCAEREAAAEVKNDVAEHADAAVGQRDFSRRVEIGRKIPPFARRQTTLRHQSAQPAALQNRRAVVQPAVQPQRKADDGRNAGVCQRRQAGQRREGAVYHKRL